MKRFLPPVVLVAAFLLTLVGCSSESYSPAIKYTLRSDPLVIEDKLGTEDNPSGDRFDPDPPGVLPLLAAKDLSDPRNPLYGRGQTLFEKNKLRDPKLLSSEDRGAILAFLDQTFGTPAGPWVGQIETNARDILKLGEEELKRGSSLYRVHCLHCHGVTGDGRGPTARWINPHPRDYRQGLFKFASVNQTGGPKPPRREDLYRVIHQGIEGTAMPSFALLPSQDLDDLVGYVIHLSIRGKVEYDTIKSAFTYESGKLVSSIEGSLLEYLSTVLTLTVKDWQDSQIPSKAINPNPYPYKDWDTVGGKKQMTKALKDSIRRGHQLFIGQGADKATETMPSKEQAKAANCVSCHTDYGRQAKFKWDAWGTLSKPRDLTQGVFRGGRRPIDVYNRIHSGISGAGMTSFANVLPPPDDGKSDPLWDLVNFVQTLPYPAMRKELGIVID